MAAVASHGRSYCSTHSRSEEHTVSDRLSEQSVGCEAAPRRRKRLCVSPRMCVRVADYLVMHWCITSFSFLHAHTVLTVLPVAHAANAAIASSHASRLSSCRFSSSDALRTIH